MPKSIRLLSGGAAQGLVKQLQDRFAQESGFAIRGTFGAVGAMREKLLGGEACDLVISTQAIVDELANTGHVAAGSARPLGAVRTGLAVVASEPDTPYVGTPAALKEALQRATGVYFPDPEKATAGIHFMKVLKTLGIDIELAARFHPYPNGATAMREMAQANQKGVIGCTQITEILYTPGVRWVGLLPAEFELATVYTAAICKNAQQPQAAAAFVQLLSGPSTASVRQGGGFESV